MNVVANEYVESFSQSYGYVPKGGIAGQDGDCVLLSFSHDHVVFYRIYLISLFPLRIKNLNFSLFYPKLVLFPSSCFHLLLLYFLLFLLFTSLSSIRFLFVPLLFAFFFPFIPPPPHHFLFPFSFFLLFPFFLSTWNYYRSALPGLDELKTSPFLQVDMLPVTIY